MGCNATTRNVAYKHLWRSAISIWTCRLEFAWIGLERPLSGFVRFGLGALGQLQGQPLSWAVAKRRQGVGGRWCLDSGVQPELMDA